MKKKLVIFFMILNSVNAISAMDWTFGLGRYIRNKWCTQTEALPSCIDALNDFGLKEFLNDSELTYVKQYGGFNKKIHEKVHAIDMQDRTGWTAITAQEKVLLDYARSMAKHEKEWKSWHADNRSKTVTISTDSFTSITTVDGLESCEEEFTIDGKKIQLRQDKKSPFYKKYTLGFVVPLTDDCEKRADYVNAYQNAAYHDELKYLQTEQCKMEIVRQDKVKSELLKQKIESLKKDENRQAFAYECKRNLERKFFETPGYKE